MSYKTDSIEFTGNNGLARTVQHIANESNIRVTAHNSTGWILKQHVMSIYGHSDDIASFKRKVDDVVNSHL